MSATHEGTPASTMTIDGYVETDMSSPDYGRVTNTDLAQEVASMQNAAIDSAVARDSSELIDPAAKAAEQQESGHLDRVIMSGIAARVIEASGVEIPDNTGFLKHNIAAYYSEHLNALNGDELAKYSKSNPLRTLDIPVRENGDLMAALNDANGEYYGAVDTLKRNNIEEL